MLAFVVEFLDVDDSSIPFLRSSLGFVVHEAGGIFA